MIEFASGVT